MASKSVRVHPWKDVLVDVDLQWTFMPGGGLPVAEGDGILPVVRRVHPHFVRERRFLTLDRHPRGHVSLASSYLGRQPYELLLPIDTGSTQEHRLAPHALFTPEQLQVYLVMAGFQTLWPDHALVGSGEDALHPDIDPRDYAYVQVKGTDPLCDSYSGFRDNLRRPTGLATAIRAHAPEAERVFLTGLAYDFCVGWTALDAVEEGFEAVIVKDATRPVGLPGSVEGIEEKFAARGVRIVESSDLRS